MKKYLFLLAVLAVYNNSQAIDLSGSSIDYTAKFSNTENYAEKDGEVEFQLNFDHLKLKYSTDIVKGESEGDTSLDVTYDNKIDKKTSYQIMAKANTSEGTEFNIDTTSDDTYLEHKYNNKITFTLYPFNSISTVGDELETLEVAQINYFSSKFDYANKVSNLPKTKEKTIPGVQVKYTFDNINSAYFTIGAVEYDCPVAFDFATLGTVEKWQSRIDMAYKFGYTYDNALTVIKFEYATHDDSEKAGSMLESAGSLQVTKEINNFILNFEGVYTKAGKNPYFVDDDGEFVQKTAEQPVYLQDWVGESDFALYAKLSYEVDQNLYPFVQITRYGEKFIYDGENSAHKLRTYDEDSNLFNSSKSHGGLNVIRAGVTYEYKKASITPFYEYKKAKNKVFASKDDLTAKDDYRTSDLKDTSYVFGINIKCEF